MDSFFFSLEAIKLRFSSALLSDLTGVLHSSSLKSKLIYDIYTLAAESEPQT